VGHRAEEVYASEEVNGAEEVNEASVDEELHEA